MLMCIETELTTVPAWLLLRVLPNRTCADSSDNPQRARAMWGPSQAQGYPSPQVMQPLQQVQPMQTQPLQQVQPTQMQSGKTFIFLGPQYCAPFPTKYFMRDDMFNWSGEDATATDDKGYVLFTVDAKMLSLRDYRSLKNAALSAA